MKNSAALHHCFALPSILESRGEASPLSQRGRLSPVALGKTQRIINKSRMIDPRSVSAHGNLSTSPDCLLCFISARKVTQTFFKSFCILYCDGKCKYIFVDDLARVCLVDLSQCKPLDLDLVEFL